MKLCTCPGGASLPKIPNVTCPENFGQIAKVAFQRIYSKGSTKNSFVQLSADIKELSAWQTFIGASDGTKISISPIVEAPTQDGGDPIEFGGGNETLGGMPTIVGSNPTQLQFALRSCPQDVIAELKKLMCEKSLGVYLISENGQIEAIEDKEMAGTYYPIPIYNLYVGDKIHGGFETPDNNGMQFSLPANYSDELKVITPSFNPLIELIEA